MSAANSRDMLLFVAGEPGPAEDPLRDIQPSVLRRMLGTVVGGWWQGPGRGASPTGRSSTTPAPNEPPWHFPASQIQCINLVNEIAGSYGARIGLIDVNRPTQYQSLIDRWVGPDGILPVLVRMDGARLQGYEHFTPRRIRSFIQGG